MQFTSILNMISVKLLGIFDISAAILFWLFAFFAIIPEKFLLLAAFYLLVKGVIFLVSRDIASIFDIISSAIIFLALNFTIPKAIVIIVSLFLLQKGIFSLLS